MKTCWFHKWKNLNKIEKYKFYGEMCEREVGTKYGICSKCHTIREYFYDSQEGAWRTVDECRSNVLKKYIDFDKFTLNLPNPNLSAPPKQE